MIKEMVGFAFRGFDKGLKKTIAETTSGFAGIRAALDGFHDLTVKVTTQNLNLTTSFEQSQYDMTQTARHTLYNYGTSVKELGAQAGEATGIATRLGIGISEATDAIHTAKTNTDAWTDAGFKNAAMIAKLGDMTNQNTVGLGQQLDVIHDLAKGDKKLYKEWVDTAGQAGRATQDMGGALGSVKDTLNDLRRVSVTVGDTLDTKMIGKLVTGKYKIESFYATMTKDPKLAIASAQAMSEAFVRSHEDMSGLMTGIQSQFPDVIQSLGIASGNIGKVMANLKEGPEAASNSLIDMYASLKASGANARRLLLFKQYVQKALGGDAGATAVISQAGEKLSDLLKGAKSPQERAKIVAGFHKLGQAQTGMAEDVNKAYGDNLTLGKRMDLATDRLIKHFRDIGRKGAADYVTQMEQAYSGLGKSLAQLGKAQTPLGRFVKKMSEISSLGWKALIPSNLIDLLMGKGPLAMEAGKQLPFMQRLIKAVKIGLSDLWETVSGFFKSLWAGMTTGEFGGGKNDSEKLGGMLGNSLHDAWTYARDTLWPMIKQFGSDLWDGLTGSVTDSNKGSVGAQIGEALSTILSKAMDLAFDAIWGAFKKHWIIGSGIILVLVDGLVGTIGTAIGGLVSLIMANPVVAAAIASLGAGAALGTWLDKKVTAAHGGKSMGERLYDQFNPDKGYTPEQAAKIAAGDKKRSELASSLNYTPGAAAVATPSGMAAMAKPSADLTSILDSTHNPDWYDSYKTLFSKKLDDLTMAVKQMNPQAQGRTAQPAGRRAGKSNTPAAGVLNGLGVNPLSGQQPTH